MLHGSILLLTALGNLFLYTQRHEMKVGEKDKEEKEEERSEIVTADDDSVQTCSTFQKTGIHTWCSVINIFEDTGSSAHLQLCSSNLVLQQLKNTMVPEMVIFGSKSSLFPTSVPQIISSSAVTKYFSMHQRFFHSVRSEISTVLMLFTHNKFQQFPHGILQIKKVLLLFVVFYILQSLFNPLWYSEDQKFSGFRLVLRRLSRILDAG